MKFDFPYIIEVLLLLGCAFFDTKPKYARMARCCAYFFFFFFICCRACVVGGDTYDYVNYFTGASYYYLSGDQTLEPFFLLYNQFVHLFTNNDVVYVFLTSFLALFPIVFLVKRYSVNQSFSLALFFLIGPYVNYFAAFRQMLGISWLLIGMICVLADARWKWVKFTIFATLGYFTHHSIVIMAAIYLLCYFLKINRKFAIICIACSALFGVVLKTFSVADFIAVFSALNFGDLFGGRDSLYLARSLYTADQVGPIFSMLSKSIWGVAIFYYSSKEDVEHWFVKIVLFYIIISNLFYTVPNLHRLTMGLSIFSIISYTWMFRNRKIRMKPVNFFSGLMCFLLIYMIYSFFVQTTLDANRMHPYYFFFEDYKFIPYPFER